MASNDKTLLASVYQCLAGVGLALPVDHTLAMDSPSQCQLIPPLIRSLSVPMPSIIMQVDKPKDQLYHPRQTGRRPPINNVL